MNVNCRLCGMPTHEDDPVCDSCCADDERQRELDMFDSEGRDANCTWDEDECAEISLNHDEVPIKKTFESFDVIAGDEDDVLPRGAAARNIDKRWDSMDDIALGDDDEEITQMPTRSKNIAPGIDVLGRTMFDESSSFDRFIDCILIHENKQRKFEEGVPTPQRVLARRIRENPLGRIRVGRSK